MMLKKTVNPDSVNRLSKLFQRASKNQLVPVSPATENLPTFETTGEYDEQINIEEINKYVCNYLMTKTKNVSTVEEKIKILEESRNEKHLSPNAWRTIDKQINLLIKQIDDLRERKEYNDYINSVSSIINKWRLLNSENMIIRIGHKRECSPEIIILVREFMKIVGEYCPNIKLTYKNNRKSNICFDCFKGSLEEEEGLLTCNNCGLTIQFLSQDVTFDDIPRINPPTNNYQNRIIFEKCMDRYEGKQIPNWDPQKNPVWNINVMIDGVTIHCLHKDNGINPNLLTPLDMYDIFKKLSSKYDGHRYNDYYDDIILFTHYFNGWELPVLGNNRPLLLRDYDQFYKAYEEIKDEDRSSAQNGNYILYILMRRRRIGLKRQNFKLPETPSILKKAEKKTAEVFEFLERKRKERNDKEDSIPWIFEETI